MNANGTDSGVEQGLSSVEAISAGLQSVGYISTHDISTSIFLAHNLRKPILVEGPAGVGKTDLAQSTARYLDLPLIRLQCYEGLDEGKALYEWKYSKQLLYTQILKEKLHEILDGADTVNDSVLKLNDFDDLFYSDSFLEPRPLLRALQQEKGAVLLIDEVDKSDEEFEAFLLEVLSDYQVTVPELGTVSADVPPLVILTSNNQREIGDALKRRCLHLFINFPDVEREQEIVNARLPEVPASLLKSLVSFVQELRGESIKKLPSISETVDWARTLMLLHADALDADIVTSTLNVLLKHESDVNAVKPVVNQLIRAAEQDNTLGTQR